MTRKFGLYGVLVLTWILGAGACSTTSVVTPIEAPKVDVPAYVSAPHPAGTEIADLRQIFLDPKAPTSDVIKSCDADFSKLVTLSVSTDERERGTRELIRRDPLAYHWCFYGKLKELQDSLQTETYIDVKQQKTVDTFKFLVPIARAFMAEYNDSRYLRWAVTQYRKTSEWVFFRKLDLSPEMTASLVDVESPMGSWKQPQSVGSGGVLEKYGIGPSAAAGSATAPVNPIFPAIDPDQSKNQPSATADTREPASAPSAAPAEAPAPVASAAPELPPPPAPETREPASVPSAAPVDAPAPAASSAPEAPAPVAPTAPETREPASVPSAAPVEAPAPVASSAPEAPAPVAPAAPESREPASVPVAAPVESTPVAEPVAAPVTAPIAAPVAAPVAAPAAADVPPPPPAPVEAREPASVPAPVAAPAEAPQAPVAAPAAPEAPSAPVAIPAPPTEAAAPPAPSSDGVPDIVPDK